MRIGWSLYSAWLCAANILQVAYILKAAGLDVDQIAWSKAILIIAYVIYAGYTFIERNPLFGLVFIWVLTWIRASQHVGTEQERSVEIAELCTRLMWIHWVTLAAATGLVAYEISSKTISHGLLF